VSRPSFSEPARNGDGSVRVHVARPICMTESAPTPAGSEDRQVLHVDTSEYSGPLDLLLELARQQRVDLSRISILDLVNQYLAFVDRAKALKITLAADYLIMAAWLALLKSRLLLPEEKEEDLSAEDLTQALTWRMRRLSAMRQVARKLVNRPRLDQDFFSRGAPEAVAVQRQLQNVTSLYDVLQAYLWVKARDDYTPLRIASDEIVTINQAMDNMMSRLASLVGWAELGRFLPDAWQTDQELAKSAKASTLVATLELARRGKLEIRQLVTRQAVEIRARQDRHE